jgi:hypothetical protein
MTPVTGTEASVRARALQRFAAPQEAPELSAKNEKAVGRENRRSGQEHWLCHLFVLVRKANFVTALARCGI